MALAEGSSVSQLLCFMPPDRAGSRLLPRNTPAMMFVEPKPLCEGDPREGSRLFLGGSSSWVRMLRGRCIPISGLWLPRGSGECADIESGENQLTEISAPKTLGRPRVAGLSDILPPGSVLRFISGALPPPAPRPRAAGIYEAPIAAAEGSGDRGARVVCLVGVRFIPPAVDMLRRLESIIAAKFGRLVYGSRSRTRLFACGSGVRGGPAYVRTAGAAAAAALGLPCPDHDFFRLPSLGPLEVCISIPGAPLRARPGSTDDATAAATPIPFSGILKSVCVGCLTTVCFYASSRGSMFSPPRGV